MLKKIFPSAMAVALVGAVLMAPVLANAGNQSKQLGFFSGYTAPQLEFLKIRIRRYISSFQTIDSLDGAADGSGRLVGAAINLGAFNFDERYKEVLSTEFSYVTPENVSKWSALQPNGPDEYDFAPLDAFLENAEANKQLFKGHVLVWHEQLPNFINDETSPEDLARLSENHINTVLNRYAGRIYAWDVVNEAVNEDGSLRDSIWLQKLGKEFIANAFYQAKAADPHAQLLYNDFNIERINPKSNGVYNLVKELVEAGVPIDGVGFQMHLSAEFAPTTEQIVENIERFTDLGLTVNVSELDVRIAKLPWDQATKLAVQKQVYHRVVDACMRVSGCEAVTTWGLTDRYSFVDIAFGADDPLQLDEDYGRKPAYYAMVDGFVGLDSDAFDVKPNLIANSSFEAGSDGWFALGDGEVSRIRSLGIRGARGLTGRSILSSSGRTETFNGPGLDILGQVSSNQSYDVSALVTINGKPSFGDRRSRFDNANITVQLQCAGEDLQFVGIAAAEVKRRSWSRLTGSFSTPDCQLETALLYVEGPKPGVTLLIDDVSLRPQELVEAPRDDLGENLLVNGDFESGFEGWMGYAAGSAQLEEQDTFAGVGAGFAFDRVNTFDGIATELLGLAEVGTEYEFSAFVKLDDTDGSDRVIGTLFANCAAGPEFIFLSAVPAGDQTWTYFNARARMPDCDASNLQLYFEGPQPGVNFKVDNVSVREVLDQTTVETIIDSQFEGGADTEGWYGFGDAILQTTDEQAFAGTQSLLVTNRTQTFEGPAFNITPSVIAGGTYDLVANTRIRGVAETEVRVTVNAECADGSGPQFLGVASVLATDSAWSELVGSFTLPDCDFSSVQIYFEGPVGGIDIFIDSVNLVGQSSGGGGENLLTNPDFETGDLAPWGATGGEVLQVVTDPVFEGSFALSATGRTATFEGPGVDLTSVTEPGQSLAVLAQVRVANVESAMVNVTLRTTCTDGTDMFLGGGSVEANNTGWVSLTGSMIAPICDADLRRVYFEGADAGVDILIDNVSISAQ